MPKTAGLTVYTGAPVAPDFSTVLNFAVPLPVPVGQVPAAEER
jgi:hypothetical protein